MQQKIKNKPALFLIFLVIFILIAVPVTGIFIISAGHPYEMYVVNKAAAAHLESNGYTEDDFFEAHYVQGSTIENEDYYEGQYMVIFQDEPHITYYYNVSRKNHHVAQIAEKECTLQDGTLKITTDTTKHTESHCIYSETASHH